MDAHRHAHAAFHLTGRMDEIHLAGIHGSELIPALFAHHRDLTTLRYDYPLVLVDEVSGGFVEPLSAIVDNLLSTFTGHQDEDRIRQQVLRLESGIRKHLASGSDGLLSEAWDTVAKEMTAADDSAAESLALARGRLSIDGRLLDCDRSTPFEVLRQAWRLSFAERSADFTSVVAELTVRLEDVLKADFENSAEARSAENLKSSFGSGPMDQFDFTAMSRLLTTSRPSMAIPASRRERIEHVLGVLRGQQFYPDSSDTSSSYTFIFETCADAITAFRHRLPAAIEVAKAVAVGQLEAAGDYVEARHDPLFASFGDAGLDAGDLAAFPDYLVVLRADAMSALEQEMLEQILSSGLPFKVLVQTDDVIEDSAVGKGRNALALTSHRLTSMAMGLADVFVLQVPASHIARARDAFLDGMEYEGTALFSIYSGADAQTPGLAPYLVTAAALESRVFPMFTFDPAAGPDWASRFSVAGNPQADSDWPVHGLSFEDAEHQTVRETVPFTLVDFVAADVRYAEHFADVPNDAWTDHLVAVDVVVAAEVRDAEHVPSLLMVDADGILRKVIVDESVIREARRCGAMWSSLQELGGLHNSHVEAALAVAEAQFEITLKEALANQEPVVVKETLVLGEDAAGEPTVEEVLVEVIETRNPDEAYIETMRCSTCNECTQLNAKMFAYNDNQQAYIADITAGTYAQLVEAAESCQVSVIHPGKPRDPSEPGLEDLLRRAEPFL